MYNVTLFRRLDMEIYTARETCKIKEGTRKKVE